jgi:uncharacterized membrane protein
MATFPFLRKKEFFSYHEREAITEAIRQAEQKTSGEVRVYVESRCRFVDPLDRAAEIFWGLKMDLTKDRNGVLIYVALKVGQEFWNREVATMREHFKKAQPAEAIIHVIKDVGDALHTFFPYDRDTDKNELPDDIVFGH